MINQEKFARAWLDGYEVEEEKLYLVEMKGDINDNILVYVKDVKKYSFSSPVGINKRIAHTKKQLEDAGFGWVFSCEGMEVTEVE